VITIHQRYRQTDRQTGGETTCNRNTALCTKVHHAVKMKMKEEYENTPAMKVKRFSDALKGTVQNEF